MLVKLVFLEKNDLLCSFIKFVGCSARLKDCYDFYEHEFNFCNLACSDLFVFLETVRLAFIPFVGQFWREFFQFLSQIECSYQRFKTCQINWSNQLFGQK